MTVSVLRFSFLLASLFLFSSCSPREPKADFTFLNGIEPESIDPAIITGQPEGRIVNALFEGLTARNPKGHLIPGVAERWEISSNGKHYTFFLRPNARWSDGQPVTSQDFVNSWKRTLTPSIAAEYAYQLYYLRNAEAFHTGKLVDFSRVGVVATRPLVLEVELNHPTPFFLDLCAFPTLMPTPSWIIEKFGDDWIKPGKMVSNGAYVLSEWKINFKMRICANPHYWDRENVHLKTIDILPTSQANTAYNLFHAGAADLILDKGLIPTHLINEIRQRPEFHASPFLGTYFYRFNVTRKPFDNPRIRQAFALAVDKKKIVEKVTRAGEQPANHFVPPGLPGYEPAKGLGFNPERARQLLREAGFPEGKGFPLVNILYNKSEQNEAIATEIQDMWAKELNVPVQLSQQEWKVYLNSMSKLDYHISRASWVGDYNDPNTFLDMFVTDGGNNRTGWSSLEYDRLIAAAGKEVDPLKRMQIFRQAETLLCEVELPILPLYFYVGIQYYDPHKLQGIEPNILDEHPLKYVRKSPR